MNEQFLKRGQGGTLDIIGILEGTNKGSSGFDFLASYEFFLEPFRNRPITLIEIGVLNGGSLRTWRTYFPEATIIGIDHDPRCKQFETADISVMIGSQDDPEFLDSIVHKTRPTIVIDDGSHMAHHIIASFERIFPALEDGGLYIVEDAYMHYGWEAKLHLGPSKISFHDYFSKLVVQKASRVVDPDDDYGIGRYLFKHIAFVGFVNGAVVIQKKSPAPDLDAVIATAESIAADSARAQHWIGVAKLILSRGGALDHAESAARKAIEIDSRDADFFISLGTIHDRQGRLDEAIEAYRQALNRRGAYTTATHIAAWHSIGVLYSRKNLHDKAVEAFAKVVELDPVNPNAFRSMSSALERCGRLDEALQHAKRAVELASGSPRLEEFEASLATLEKRQRVDSAS